MADYTYYTKEGKEVSFEITRRSGVYEVTMNNNFFGSFDDMHEVQEDIDEYVYQNELLTKSEFDSLKEETKSNYLREEVSGWTDGFGNLLSDDVVDGIMEYYTHDAIKYEGTAKSLIEELLADEDN